MDDQFQQAVSLFRSGNLDAAAAICTELVERHPSDPAALHLLGTIGAQACRFEEASILLQRAARAAPHAAEIHHSLGAVLSYLGRFEEAARDFKRVVKNTPQNLDVLMNLGAALLSAGQAEEAIASFRKLIELVPGHAGACYNIAVAFQKKGDLAGCLTQADEALRLDPTHQLARYLRAQALQALGRLDEALAGYEDSLVRDRGFVPGWNGKGSILVARGDLDGAVAAFDEALRLDPDHADTRTNLSLVQLLRGDFANGWRNFEARKRATLRNGDRSFPVPLWLGEEDPRGKTILVHAERGLGDSIQFARFLPKLTERGARVLFLPQKSLRGLFAGLPVDLVEERRLPAFDRHIPLMSLPLALGLGEKDFAVSSPYLAADPVRVTKWRSTIGKHGFRIGISWRGSEVGRSVPLAAFAPLAQIEGVRLISLQKGAGTEEIKRIQGFAVEDLGPRFDSDGNAFMDTAAVMACLDLVVTIDTAVAHVAGALGYSAFLALAAVPDWRWQLTRQDSPWYSSLRLFRQSEAGDWAPVFMALANEARTLVRQSAPEPVA